MKIRCLVPVLVIATVAGLAQQPAVGAGGLDVFTAPPPIVWPSPPLDNGPIALDTGIQHRSADCDQGTQPALEHGVPPRWRHPHHRATWTSADRSQRSARSELQLRRAFRGKGLAGLMDPGSPPTLRREQAGSTSRITSRRRTAATPVSLPSPADDGTGRRSSKSATSSPPSECQCFAYCIRQRRDVVYDRAIRNWN